jgi:hypothetical protein
MNRLVLATAAALLAAPAAFATEVKVLDGFVSAYPASILSIDDVKVVEQVVDAEYAYKSYLVVEVTGSYESHGAADTVMLRLVRKDDGVPMNYFNVEAELTSVHATSEPVPVGNSFITAVSSPRPFKTQLKLEINGWSGDDTQAQYTVLFKHAEYSPVYHIASQGFYATLIYTDERKEWIFHKVGFEP